MRLNKTPIGRNQHGQPLVPTRYSQIAQTIMPHAYAHAMNAGNTEYGIYQEMSNTLMRLNHAHRRQNAMTFTAFRSKREVVDTTLITLIDSQDEIRQWLDIANSPRRLVLESQDLSPQAQDAIKNMRMGISATFSDSPNGRDVTFQPLSRTKVILSKDPSTPCGYAVISVHPKKTHGQPTPDYEFIPSAQEGETLADAYQRATLDTTGHGTQNMRDTMMKMRLRIGDKMTVTEPTKKQQNMVTFQIADRNGTRQFNLSRDGMDEVIAHDGQKETVPVSTRDTALRPIVPLLRGITDTPMLTDTFLPCDQTAHEKELTFRDMARIIKQMPDAALKVDRADQEMLKMHTTIGQRMTIAITKDGVALKESDKARKETIMPRAISPSLYNESVQKTLVRLKPALDTMFPEDQDCPATTLGYIPNDIDQDNAAIRHTQIDGKKTPILIRDAIPDPPMTTAIDTIAMAKLRDMGERPDQEAAKVEPKTQGVIRQRTQERTTDMPIR